MARISGNEEISDMRGPAAKAFLIFGWSISASLGQERIVLSNPAQTSTIPQVNEQTEPAVAPTILFEDRAPRSIGVVHPGANTTIRLPLNNSTNKTLEMELIRVSCACTQAKIERSQIAPGESTWVICKIHSEAPNSSQTVTLSVIMRDNANAKDKYVANYAVSAIVRADCDWSPKGGTHVSITPRRPGTIFATNYGPCKWNNLQCVITSENASAEVHMEDVLIGGEQRQKATISLSTESKNPFKDSCIIELYSTDEGVQRLVGTTEATLEMQPILRVVPEKLVIGDQGLKAFLILTDAGRTFTRDDVLIQIGDTVPKEGLVRKVSPRWVEVKIESDLKHVVVGDQVKFQVEIDGKLMEATVTVAGIE